MYLPILYAAFIAFPFLTYGKKLLFSNTTERVACTLFVNIEQVSTPNNNKFFTGNFFAVDVDVDDETVLRNTVIQSIFTKYNQIININDLLQMFNDIDIVVDHLCNRHNFDKVNVCYNSDSFDFEVDFLDNEKMNFVNIREWYGMLHPHDENMQKMSTRALYDEISSHPQIIAVMN